MKSFFNRKQKKLAFDNSKHDLICGYERSEHILQNVAKSGNDKKLERAMIFHHDLEYAMLFQKTPEYKRKKYGG